MHNGQILRKVKQISINHSHYITFLDFLDLVTFFDFLSIFFLLIWQIGNGGNQSSRSLGRYCSTIPGPFRAAGNLMWVKFVTDGSVTRTGFRATYSSGYTSLYLSVSLPIHLSLSLSLSLVLTVWMCARVHARVRVWVCVRHCVFVYVSLCLSFSLRKQSTCASLNWYHIGKDIYRTTNYTWRNPKTRK